MFGLGAALGLLPTSAAIGKIRSSVRPNQYAPTLRDQGDVAVVQAAVIGAELEDGFSTWSGSERDWFDDQGRHTIGYLPIVQDVSASGVPIAPGRLVPGDPGADDAPTTARDFYWGPVTLHAPWGGSTRTVNKSQHVLPATLLPPTTRVLAPDEFADNRDKTVPAGAQDALLNLFDGGNVW